MKKLYFLPVVATLILSCHKIQMASVSSGSEAPAFTLFDTKGDERSLSDFKGNFIILEWTNHQCPFVRKHYGSGNMQNLQKFSLQEGAVWLTILSSAPGLQGHVSPEKADSLMKESGSRATAYLFDSDGLVGRLYGAKATPHMFVINPDGKVVYQGAIDSIRSSDPADIAIAQNYVRIALTDALAGNPIEVTNTQPYGCSIKYAR